jgi:hypothetical protein
LVFLGRATSISGENVVINNCGQSALAGTFGGTYNFTHCTITNYWNNSFRQFPALLLNDFIVDADNTVTVNPVPTEANFTNCIVYGNNNPEFLLENQGSNFNFKFTNCLLRFDNDNLENTGNYQFGNSVFYEGNIFNQNPRFEGAFDNLMRIDNNSAAHGNALPLLPAGNDILGTPRKYY